MSQSRQMPSPIASMLIMVTVILGFAAWLTLGIGAGVVLGAFGGLIRSRWHHILILLFLSAAIPLGYCTLMGSFASGIVAAAISLILFIPSYKNGKEWKR